MGKKMKSQAKGRPDLSKLRGLTVQDKGKKDILTARIVFIPQSHTSKAQTALLAKL